MSLQLLKRPRPLPTFKNEEEGIHAQWQIKGFFYKKSGFPKMSIRGNARVQYANLVIEGKLPRSVVKKALVSIGYIENTGDILDIRGCNYRLLLFGVQQVELIRDWLRFLVIRQRIPHSLLGLPFEWQDMPVKNDRELRISKLHPLNCFKWW